MILHALVVLVLTPVPVADDAWRTIATRLGHVKVRDAADEPDDASEVRQGDVEGTVTFFTKGGTVRTVYTSEAVARITENAGDLGAVIAKANDTLGARGTLRTIGLVTNLEIIGLTSNDALARVQQYLEHPSQKVFDRTINNALADVGLVPEGLVDSGRSTRELLSLAADFTLLGGKSPREGLTPAFVDDLEKLKAKRMTFREFMGKWVATDLLNQQGGPTDPGKDMLSDYKPEQNHGNPVAAGPTGGGAGQQAPGKQRDRQKTREPTRHDRASRDQDSKQQPRESGNTDAGREKNQGGGETYTVTSVEKNEATGETTIGWTRSGGNDGLDGNYKTVYDGHGGYSVYDSNGDYAKDGACHQGDPPKNVKPGASTTVVVGDEARYNPDDQQMDDSNGSKDQGNGNGDGGDGSGDGSGSGDSGSGSSSSGDTGRALAEMDRQIGMMDRAASSRAPKYTPAPDNSGNGLPIIIVLQMEADLLVLKEMMTPKLWRSRFGHADATNTDPSEEGMSQGSSSMSRGQWAAFDVQRKLLLLGNPTGVDAHGTKQVDKERPRYSDAHQGAVDPARDH